MPLASITDVSLISVLENLKSAEWQVPRFQREFVWTVSDVEALAESILRARPIGMVTLWARSIDPDLTDLEPISLPDTNPDGAVFFANSHAAPATRFAILDGRQRCTAIAMAFGGFRALNGLRKHAGAFFLNLKSGDSERLVRFFKQTEITKRGFHSLTTCLAAGYMPLAAPDVKDVFQHWSNARLQVAKAETYPDGTCPDDEELARRGTLIEFAHQNLFTTRMAVYTVPSAYSLGDICEIFETLNTTGTKVSTVDLLHSILYAESVKNNEPLELREWIDSLGNLRGAIGWALKDDRPELTAQIVTACYVAQDEKAPPRAVGGQVQPIASVKAGDLLGTPYLHWRRVMQPENTELLAGFLADFQMTVAGGLFPYRHCPYPASAAIYVALRWRHHFAEPADQDWTIAQLNAAYRSFFWRNALSGRYDQGFLTQIGSDIKSFIEILKKTSSIHASGEWREAIDGHLKRMINKTVPDEKELTGFVTDAGTGAVKQATRLRILARAEKDLLDPSVLLTFEARTEVELHHIFPKNWCRNNKVGDLKKRLDALQSEGRDWVNSASNLMPLSKASNLEWMAQLPHQVLLAHNVSWSTHDSELRMLFITEESFKSLASAPSGDYESVGRFWDLRAASLVSDLIELTKVSDPFVL